MSQDIQQYHEPEATPVGHSGTRVVIQERPAWAISGWAGRRSRARQGRRLHPHEARRLARALWVGPSSRPRCRRRDRQGCR